MFFRNKKIFPASELYQILLQSEQNGGLPESRDKYIIV